MNVTFLQHADRDRFDIRLMLLTRPWEKGNVFLDQVQGAGYPVSLIPVALRPRSRGTDYFRVARCVRHLHRLLSGQSFDLVHTHGYFADIISVPVCSLLGVPHISTCHGYTADDGRLSLYNRLDKLMLRFCDRVIVVSEELGRELKASGVRTSKIVVIQNAVAGTNREHASGDGREDARRSLAIGRDAFTIGYAGRLSREKGVEYLIRAARQLKEEDASLKVLILGDGPQREDLERLARSLGLETEILFLGFRQDVQKWLAAMDVFVLPSLTEGTPIALLEAMSLGIPVVATSVGGVPGVVEDGISGCLVEPGDVRGLGEKISAYRRDARLRQGMADRAAGIVRERFDAGRWCLRIEEQYEELLGEGRHG